MSLLTIGQSVGQVRLPTRSVRDFTGRWYVAHTKSRFEKAFALDLEARRIDCFLPLVSRLYVSGGKKRRTDLPMFPSYVFFCGSEQDRYQALCTGRLCRVIDVSDQERLLDELISLELATSGGGKLTAHPFVPVGSNARVASGPFEGMEGLVIRHQNGTRLLLQVSLLGQGVSMEIDSELLETI